MTGLDKILAQIKSDADNVCADINSKNIIKCEQIIFDAEEKAKDILKKGADESKKKYDDIISRANSTADLERRAVILRAKQEIISASLNSAREYLCTLPDKEYFSLILNMARKYSEESAGVIEFSKKDLGRLPSDFESQLNKVIRGSLTISDSYVDIDGGFVITYGGIEVNCSFASIFSSEFERFSDEAAKILFG